jgi:hypothetical protein
VSWLEFFGAFVVMAVLLTAAYGLSACLLYFLESDDPS